MWNLENWYRRSYLQYRNSYSDIENKHMDTKKGRGKGRKDWEIGIDIYAVLCITKIDN